jgi:hypothetical protein
MDRTVARIPTIVLEAVERLEREDAAGTSAFDDFAAAGWDTYRVARMRFLAGLDDGGRPSPEPVHDPLALRESHGR